MRQWIAGCLVAAACGNYVQSAPVAKVPAAMPSLDPPGSSCARRGAGVAAASPVGHAREGNAVALARRGDRLLAYVADADSKSIHTVSVDEKMEIARTRVNGAPKQLLVLADGRLLASLADGTNVAVLEPAAKDEDPLVTLCEREVGAEPFGLAATADDATLVVTSAFGATLSVLDAATLSTKRVVGLSRDPRSVLVDDSGVAYVSHLVGAKMTAVDLDDPSRAPKSIDLAARKSTSLASVGEMLEVRGGSQGYALAIVTTRQGRRVLEPLVTLEASEGTEKVYYAPPFDGVPKETPMVSVVEVGKDEPLSRYVLGTAGTAFTRECLLPRAAAVSEKSGSLLVACYGIDALLELDALAVDPFRVEKRRFAVPPGPEGVAVDEDGARAVVFSQMGGAVTVIDLQSGTGARVALDYRPDPELYAAMRGRQLFYRTDDERVSGDGLACSSCHPDGRDDGNTWRTPLGLRQTPMLAGRVTDTAPFGWEGDQPTLADYIGHTVKNLGGKGLAGADLADLAKFLHATTGPPRGRVDATAVADGKALFARKGCDLCHLGGTGTDALTHDLDPSARAGSWALPLDTPSLRFVAGTGPYFHDGRYPTLDALLTDPASKMGETAGLSDDERGALEAYLRSL